MKQPIQSAYRNSELGIGTALHWHARDVPLTSKHVINTRLNFYGVCSQLRRFRRFAAGRLGTQRWNTSLKNKKTIVTGQHLIARQ